MDTAERYRASAARARALAASHAERSTLCDAWASLAESYDRLAKQVDRATFPNPEGLTWRACRGRGLFTERRHQPDRPIIRR